MLNFDYHCMIVGVGVGVPSINDVMLFWYFGTLFTPPPLPSCFFFYASFNIVCHADPNTHTPLPLRHDVIYGRPQVIRVWRSYSQIKIKVTRWIRRENHHFRCNLRIEEGSNVILEQLHCIEIWAY